jgi:hypothetical protein
MQIEEGGYVSVLVHGVDRSLSILDDTALAFDPFASGLLPPSLMVYISSIFEFILGVALTLTRDLFGYIRLLVEADLQVQSRWRMSVQ